MPMVAMLQAGWFVIHSSLFDRYVDNVMTGCMWIEVGVYGNKNDLEAPYNAPPFERKCGAQFSPIDLYELPHVGLRWSSSDFHCSMFVMFLETNSLASNLYI